jgi:hypothetical protein
MAASSRFQPHASPAEASRPLKLPSKLKFPVSSQYLGQSLKSVKKAGVLPIAAPNDTPRWEMVVPKMARHPGRAALSAPDPVVRLDGNRPNQTLVAQAFSLCKKVFRSLLVRAEA